MNIENQTSSELNSLWDGVKMMFTDEAKTKLLQFAKEKDQNIAQVLRNDVKKVLDFLKAVKDERKRINASVQPNTPPEISPPMPAQTTQPFGSAPAQNNNPPQPAVPAMQSNNPSNNPAQPAVPSMQSNNPAQSAAPTPEPSIFGSLGKLFGGKPRTFRHRAYYNNTLRNFR
jgi:hypothetical protein